VRKQDVASPLQIVGALVRRGVIQADDEVGLGRGYEPLLDFFPRCEQVG